MIVEGNHPTTTARDGKPVVEDVTNPKVGP